MTKEEILAMEAGRELDKLVAETFGDYTDRTDWHQDRIYHRFLPNREGGWVVPAPVSTEISAAWQVVEKIRDTEDSTLQNAFVNWLMNFADIYPDDTANIAIFKLFFYQLSPTILCKATLLAKLEK